MSATAPSHPDSVDRIWAFDLGKGSIGEAVRRGSKIEYAASLLIPAELAQRGPATSPGTPAAKYRAMKTREAHRAREDRLRAICMEAGIEALAAKRVAPDKDGTWRVVHEADPRLTREFPAKGDNTCYTSCLLRIKLLQGEPLASWQVYKALYSSIQRRGYDPKPAWIGRRSERQEKADEEKVTKQRMDAYRGALELMAPGRTEFHYPCYLDARRMGLWSPDRPEEKLPRISHNAEPARNRDLAGTPPIVAPRDLVIAECHALLEAAARLFPKFGGHADEILFGSGGVPYASFDANLRKLHGLHQGGAGDWNGILGQKVPRFDNRIIAKCALIPRLNVCSSAPREHNGQPVPDSLLAAEVTLLMKLKNLQVDCGTGRLEGLSHTEIETLFLDRKQHKPASWAYKPSALGKALAKLGRRPALGHAEVAAPNLAGRSRFSRPALRILRDLILSGRSPNEQRALELSRLNGNTDLKRGLIRSDLDFLPRMGDVWSKLYVPDQQHDALLAVAEHEGRAAAIRKLIGDVNDPIVRHRLETFWQRLRDLQQRFGLPGHVVLEFVRTDFMGDRAKRDLALFQKKREQERKTARADALKLDAGARAAATKLELLRAQGCICLYTGDTLSPTNIEILRIEHIVPRNHPSVRGPDAMINYVVTTEATNKLKDNRTPHEWFAARNFEGWDAYKRRVEACATALGRKKVMLLTSPEAPQLVNRYTALAETAWIAKLSQTLTALHFGWPIRSEKGERRISVINGGLTARVRRKYQLNSLLNPCPEGEDARDWEEKCQKNRDDDRHHALDAMVISFIPGWVRDPGKEGFFCLPEAVTRETFGAALNNVLPTNLILKRPSLEATAYGERTIDERRFAVARAEFKGIAVKTERNGKRSLKLRKDIETETHRIVDPVIRHDVEHFVETSQGFTLETWDRWCEIYRRGGPHGPHVKKLMLTVSRPDELSEYADLSKDATGQLRKGDQHQGYFIVEVPKPTKKLPDGRAFEVRPAYIHQSLHKLKESLTAESGTRIFGYFQSGCLVQIDKPIDHAKTPLKPGVYRLNSIWEQGNIVVTDQASRVSKPIGIVKFVTAGLRRLS